MSFIPFLSSGEYFHLSYYSLISCSIHSTLTWQVRFRWSGQKSNGTSLLEYQHPSLSIRSAPLWKVLVNQQSQRLVPLTFNNWDWATRSQTSMWPCQTSTHFSDPNTQTFKDRIRHTSRAVGGRKRIYLNLHTHRGVNTPLYPPVLISRPGLITAVPLTSSTHSTI